MTPAYTIIHRPEKGRFETTIAQHTAFIEYEIKTTEIVFTHTIVPPPLEGKGIAAALVKEALTWAINNHFTISATCSYVNTYLLRHPEYKK